MNRLEDNQTSSSSIDLSIVIVSWNTKDLLRSCLHSIDVGKGDMALQVIVVDSGSSDQTPTMVVEEFPWVTLISCRDNVGFPKGNNIGIAEAEGRNLMLLNPDTEVQGDALQTMTEFIESHPEVGVIGPMLLYPSGSIQSSRRRFPTVATALFESTWLERLAPRSLLDKYYAADLPDDQISEVDWLVGACLMTKAQVIKDVGLLDEDYFMYSEELDWCRRVKDADWKVVYYPAASVVHHVGKSSEQAVTDRHINFQRAKLRYFRKYHGRAASGFIRLALLLNYGFQLLFEGMKGLVGHRRELRKQRVQAYWRVLRSGLKPAGY